MCRWLRFVAALVGLLVALSPAEDAEARHIHLRAGLEQPRKVSTRGSPLPGPPHPRRAVGAKHEHAVRAEAKSWPLRSMWFGGGGTSDIPGSPNHERRREQQARVTEVDDHAEMATQSADKKGALPDWIKSAAVVAFYLFLVGYVVWLIGLLIVLLCKYNGMLGALESQNKPDFTFGQYVRYRFAYWFVWDEYAKLVVLLSICFVFMMAGSTIYVLSLQTTLGHAVYVVFTILVEPDGGKGETTFDGKVIGGVVSVGGLVLFAVLMAFTQQRFNTLLEHFRDGSSDIIESGHFVIVGWTDQALDLISEICEAYMDRGGCKIAVLSDVDKPVIEGYIQSALRQGRFELGGSRVIVRSGAVFSARSLRLAGAHTCRTVIILSDASISEEMRDAQAIRVLLTLRSKCWPKNDGRILVECSRQKNFRLFKEIGGHTTHVVTVSDFVGRIIVQCSRQCGISAVIKQTLGFKGSEFYIRPAPQFLVGLYFRDAMLHFPDAVLAAIVPFQHKEARSSTSLAAQELQEDTDGGFTWFPKDYVIQESDDLLIYAENDSAIDPQKDPVTGGTTSIVLEVHGSQELGFEVDLPPMQSLVTVVDQGSFASHHDVQVGDELMTVNGLNVSELSADECMMQLQCRPTCITFSRQKQAPHAFLVQHSDEQVLPLRSARLSSLKGCLNSETILLLGWSDTMWHILSELNASVQKGTHIVSYSHTPEHERREYLDFAKLYFNESLENIDVKYVTGVHGSRFGMEQTLTEDILSNVSRVFVLAETSKLLKDNGEPLDANAGVIPTVLHIRSLMLKTREIERQEKEVSEDEDEDENEKEIPIVAEVGDKETEEHCRHVRVHDYVDSAAISAQALSMIAYEPRLADMLYDFVSEKGRMNFAIRGIEHYVPKHVLDRFAQDNASLQETDISFFDVVRLALQHDELVLGWSKEMLQRNEATGEMVPRASVLTGSMSTDDDVPRSADDILAQTVWEMNPEDKLTRRRWFAGVDKLLVLCERQAFRSPFHSSRAV